MGLKEMLKKQGYTDEQIKAIMDGMAENKLHISSVENADETIKQLQEEKAKLQDENAKLQESSKKTDPSDLAAADEIAKLREAVNQGKINTSVIVALTKANAADVDYLMYQAEKTGAIKDVKIDDSGKVTGVDELVEGLKKSHAGQFTAPAAAEPAMVRVGVKKLENTDPADDTPQTLAEAIAQKYSGDEE